MVPRHDLPATNHGDSGGADHTVNRRPHPPALTRKQLPARQPLYAAPAFFRLVDGDHCAAPLWATGSSPSGTSA
jgi:hypothetical protein